MDAKGREDKYSDAAVEIRLAPAGMGAVYVAMAAIATLAVIAATPGFDAARILAATWVVCAGLEAVHSRARLRGRRAVRELHVRGTAVEVCDGAGRWRKGTIRAGSFVAPWLTIVRWRPEGARFDRSVPILPGMAPAGQLRRLRVVLKWA
jgi:toxin CptA